MGEGGWVSGVGGWVVFAKIKDRLGRSIGTIAVAGQGWGRNAKE